MEQQHPQESAATRPSACCTHGQSVLLQQHPEAQRQGCRPVTTYCCRSFFFLLYPFATSCLKSLCNNLWEENWVNAERRKLLANVLAHKQQKGQAEFRFVSAGDRDTEYKRKFNPFYMLTSPQFKVLHLSVRVFLK